MTLSAAAGVAVITLARGAVMSSASVTAAQGLSPSLATTTAGFQALASKLMCSQSFASLSVACQEASETTVKVFLS